MRDEISCDLYPLLNTKRRGMVHQNTASHAGLVGGGKVPRPGEISLAHRGVLFLDELPEFDERSLESMRQSREDRMVTLSRASGTLTFPANFQLIAAMNPCPCGYWGDPTHNCTCSPAMVTRYQKRISGPLLDRFDTRSAPRRRASSTRNSPPAGLASRARPSCSSRGRSIAC